MGSIYSTCLPISPPCLPQAPPAPSQEQFSPPQGTISLDTPSTQPSPGFRGSPDHPAVGRAPGFSPAPSSPLEGLPLGTPSPSGPASQGPLCSMATPALVIPVQAKADLRAGLCTRPSGHSCPCGHSLTRPPVRCSAGAPMPHRPRGHLQGQWACLLGLSRWGSGC